MSEKLYSQPPAPYEAECGGQKLKITEAVTFPHRVEDLNLSCFGITEVPMIRRMLEVLEEWVRDPIIEDTIANHNARRNWEDTIPEDVRSFLDNYNKLGIGQIASVINSLQTLPRLIEKQDPLLAESLRSAWLPHAGIVHEFNRVKKLGLSGQATYLSLVKTLDKVVRDYIGEFFPKDSSLKP